ncbi:hypothetical protein EVAR_58784_1 [Eumeta japonica]|uniref:Uncharacterized protein n=1 Tax=Eumeta variegata TaxID=151549 RepID=A0A4C1YJQ4_EUMVA|nr:hypothetical protein EVAR_58784_1 [Eumeta japonica]
MPYLNFRNGRGPNASARLAAPAPPPPPPPIDRRADWVTCVAGRWGGAQPRLSILLQPFYGLFLESSSLFRSHGAREAPLEPENSRVRNQGVFRERRGGAATGGRAGGGPPRREPGPPPPRAGCIILYVKQSLPPKPTTVGVHVHFPVEPRAGPTCTPCTSIDIITRRRASAECARRYLAREARARRTCVIARYV